MRGGGLSHACGQWSGCGQIPIFLGEGTKKISVPNDQQCRIFTFWNHQQQTTQSLALV